MSDDRQQFAADMRQLLVKYHEQLLGPEIVGELGFLLVRIMSSAPAEHRMAFAEEFFAQLLDRVRKTLQ